MRDDSCNPFQIELEERGVVTAYFNMIEMWQ